jgi:hypothetical protein
VCDDFPITVVVPGLCPGRVYRSNHDPNAEIREHDSPAFAANKKLKKKTAPHQNVA